jgi:ion channel POLLUX/CASTOR
MVRKLGELNGGRTQVYERGHEVILGWNSRLPRVLRQIAIASESNGDRVRIVVLADEDKEMMDARIKEYVTRGEFKHVTIINRSGDPTSRADQDLVAIGSAKKVLILSGTDDDDASDDGDGGAANGDSLAFKTALALKHSAAAAGVRTVVESRSARNDGMDACLGPNFTQLLWPDLASRHIVKAALQPSGLVDVHRELLDFDGHELYTRGFRELEGRSVEEASKMLRGGLLVGIARRTGEVLLNPVGREVVGRGDQVVLLAENKTRTSVTELSGTGAGGNGAVARVDVGSGGGRVTIAAPRRNVLVLGWRPGMSRILDEIDGTVGAGSRVSIVAAVPEARRRAVLERERYAPGRARNVRVLHTEADPCDVDSVARALGAAGRVDSVLVLMDHASPARNNRQRESRVLESLVALRMGLARRGRPAAAAAARAPNIVAEVMSLETERLARADNPGIEAVSLDEFSALLLAQAAYEPDMLSTLRTLLSRDGPEMALRPAWGLYRSGEDAVTFDALVRRGRERRETVLGYIANADGRLVLNPAKATVVPRAAVRHIVAIVEDIHAVVGP